MTSKQHILNMIEEARCWENDDYTYDKALNAAANAATPAESNRILETFYNTYVQHVIDEKYELLNTGHTTYDESLVHMDPKGKQEPIREKVKPGPLWDWRVMLIGLIGYIIWAMFFAPK